MYRRFENVDFHNIRRDHYSNLSIELVRALLIWIASDILFETSFKKIASKICYYVIELPPNLCASLPNLNFMIYMLFPRKKSMPSPQVLCALSVWKTESIAWLLLFTKGFVVDHERAIRMFEGCMRCENRIVRLDDSRWNLWSWIDGEFKFRFLPVVDRQAFHHQRCKAWSGSAWKKKQFCSNKRKD